MDIYYSSSELFPVFVDKDKITKKIVDESRAGKTPLLKKGRHK
jgi:hypothetical protein